MNERFLALPEEKRQRIINAALQMFAQHDYKHAATDDIAAHAGISKGLLFYYFQNKQALYLYLHDYVVALMQSSIAQAGYDKTTDFFDLLDDASEVKMRMIAQNPYLMEFAMRAFYSDNEAMQTALRQTTQGDAILKQYFTQVDFTKFRDGVDPAEVLNMLVWMSEGYLDEQRRMGNSLDLDEMMRNFRRWKNMFRSMTYKEEFLK